MQKIKVNLKDRSYDIVIGTDILAELPSFIRSQNCSKVIIISDTTVDSLYGKTIAKALKDISFIKICIPPGEKHKTLYTASAIYDQLVDLKAHRDSFIIALGGGVINDLVGFVAATYMRGVPFIQIPTTLLASVDASIGGKTAVDHEKGKNLIGVFYQPKLVLADTEFLKTLPPREIKTGLAEVLKYGIIKDPKIFEMLESDPKATPKFWEEIIARCAKIKASVVSRDEKETSGLRMILNLGHTFGHAIESLTGYSKYNHGEAVALGILASAYLSNNLNILDQKSVKRIAALIKKLKLPVLCGLRSKDIIQLMLLDKKVKSGKLRIVLPKKIGSVVIRDDIKTQQIEKALKMIGCK